MAETGVQMRRRPAAGLADAHWCAWRAEQELRDVGRRVVDRAVDDLAETVDALFDLFG